MQTFASSRFFIVKSAKGDSSKKGKEYIKIPIPSKITNSPRLRAIEREHKNLLEVAKDTVQKAKELRKERRKATEKLILPFREIAEKDSKRIFGEADDVEILDPETDF